MLNLFKFLFSPRYVYELFTFNISGGGGGGGQAPVQQTVSNTNIPEYARPYVETMLGKTEALTDINQNPYQTYGGQRIADFSPLQQQAFSNVTNATTSSQLNPATGLAAASGFGSLGIAGQMANSGQNYANQATDPYAQQAYMSPYIQNALQPQLQEINRQYDITGQQERSRATGQGAFGGNRQALAGAENERNKNMAMNQAIGTGYQDAFKAAQQAQQFGANIGLQGYQGALSGLGQAGQAANTLGQLGQTQFGQQQAINRDQQTTGAVQQAQAQQGLDTAYQDFMKQKNYPYQQLAFQSDMLRGLPLSQSANTLYQAPPNAGSQLGGLGLTALSIYGNSRGVANGGLLAAKAYKEGGSIGYSTGGDISMMSMEQLKKLLESPSITPIESEMIQKQIMLLQRMENNPATQQIMNPQGIDSIPTGDMVQPEGMAGGGIVAFANGGSNDESYRQFLENQTRKSIEEQLNGNAFSKSEADKAELRQSLKNRKENNIYDVIGQIGGGMAAGTSQNFLTNLGAGLNQGVQSQVKARNQDMTDMQKLYETQVYADKAEDARKSALTGQMNTTLGHMYAKDAARTAAAVGSEDKALLKVMALINQDDDIPKLIKERDLLGPGDKNYKAYNDAINAIKKGYFEQAGIKRPFVASPGVQLVPEVEKESFLSSINPFKSKPETPKAKVVPYSSLPK